MIEDRLTGHQGHVYVTKERLTNWMAEALPDQYPVKIANNKFPSNDNTILMCEDPSQPDKPVEELEGINLRD
ncbi:hypothetical protein CR513_08620, partial [Mucuna pruriens]